MKFSVLERKNSPSFGGFCSHKSGRGNCERESEGGGSYLNCAPRAFWTHHFLVILVNVHPDCLVPCVSQDKKELGARYDLLCG